jgi:hypothetical protein
VNNSEEEESSFIFKKQLDKFKTSHVLSVAIRTHQFHTTRKAMPTLSIFAKGCRGLLLASDAHSDVTVSSFKLGVI